MKEESTFLIGTYLKDGEIKWNEFSSKQEFSEAWGCLDATTAIGYEKKGDKFVQISA